MDYLRHPAQLDRERIQGELYTGMRGVLLRVWASGGEMMNISGIMNVLVQTLDRNWDPTIQRFNIPLEMMLTNMGLSSGGQLRPDTRQAIVGFLTTHPHVNIQSVAYISRPEEEMPPVIMNCCDCQRGRMMAACQREPRNVGEASQILLKGIRAALVDLQYKGHYLDGQIIEGIVRGCAQAFSRRSWYPHERGGKGAFRLSWTKIVDGARHWLDRLPHQDRYAPTRAISKFLRDHPWVASCN